jgi:UPF0755 protein
VTKILAVLAVLLVLGGIGAWQWKKNEDYKWRWEAIPMKERVATVPADWSVATLAERLQKSGKVRDAATFREAAQQVGLEKVAPGGYELPAKAGPRELAQIFRDAPDLVKVTFPEGFTARQIARRLEANNFAAADELLQKAYPPGKPVSPLEGRLFPDTYWMPIKGDARAIVGKFHERFAQVMAELPKKLPIGADGKPLTRDQVLILASLVERETPIHSERPLVAGVLLNRLRKGMRLQCDATVQYAREMAKLRGQTETGHKERLLYRDLEINSPYNTYKIAGLPPGPICNPGRESILAAAKPKSSPYFFYVMSPKLKRHRFAVTFAEHGRNVRLARQEREELER